MILKDNPAEAGVPYRPFIDHRHRIERHMAFSSPPPATVGYSPNSSTYLESKFLCIFGIPVNVTQARVTLVFKLYNVSAYIYSNYQFVHEPSSNLNPNTFPLETCSVLVQGIKGGYQIGNLL